MLDTLEKLIAPIERWLRKLILVRLPIWLSSDLLDLIWKILATKKILLILAIITLLVGLLSWSAKLIAIAGIVFEVLGIISLVLRDKIDDIVSKYKANKYPSGPPSYVSWLMFANDDPDAYYDDTHDVDLREKDARVEFFASKSDLAPIIFGAFLQLLAVIIA